MATPREAPVGHMPDFEVTTIAGEHVRYRDHWQRRNLVLVVVTAGEREIARRYLTQLELRRADLDDTVVVITTHPVRGISAPAVLVADRWGEIQHRADARLPRVDELMSWVRFVQIQCPECPP
jgi:hypothetical protein